MSFFSFMAQLLRPYKRHMVYLRVYERPSVVLNSESLLQETSHKARAFWRAPVPPRPREGRRAFQIRARRAARPARAPFFQSGPGRPTDQPSRGTTHPRRDPDRNGAKHSDRRLKKGRGRPRAGVATRRRRRRAARPLQRIVHQIRPRFFFLFGRAARARQGGRGRGSAQEPSVSIDRAPCSSCLARVRARVARGARGEGRQRRDRATPEHSRSVAPRHTATLRARPSPPCVRAPSLARLPAPSRGSDAPALRRRPRTAAARVRARAQRSWRGATAVVRASPRQEAPTGLCVSVA